MARTDTMPKIVLPREELIAKLEARRPWAKALDKRNTAKHKADEKALLDGFRARCRDALKWSYADLKKNGYEVEVRYSERIDCPASVEASLDRALNALKHDRRKTITVTDNNENSRIFWLLTYDENLPVDVC